VLSDGEGLLVDASPVEALLTAVESKSARIIIVGGGASGRIRAAPLRRACSRSLTSPCSWCRRRVRFDDGTTVNATSSGSGDGTLE
jgi:hypothetical protein